MEKIHKIGKFIVLETIGCGGFSTVYRSRDEETGKYYALKVGNNCIRREYHQKKKVIEDMTHMEEWNAYKALEFGKGKNNERGIPEVFETGIAQLPDGSLRPYLVMQLLGRSLTSVLADPDYTKERLLQLGHTMLEIVELIHSIGFIHRDIKPSNFCFRKRAGRNGDRPLFILDFGFACEKPDSNDPLRDDFVGTPDYASTPALCGKRQSFRDDLESLAYTLLELWLGDLPWYLTTTKSAEGGWTQKNLQNMSIRRENTWKSLVKNEKIPVFLVDWVEYCKELRIVETPDYNYLHSLLTQETVKVTMASGHKRKSPSSSSEGNEESESSDSDFNSQYKRICFASEE